MRALRLLVMNSLLLLSAGCCAPLHHGVAPDRAGVAAGRTYLRTELFFGLTRPDGAAIDPEHFRAFIDAEVTPRFPDGLTLVGAQGQWRGDNGEIVHEPSMLLMLLYPADTREVSDAKIEAIRGAYIRRFAQESVLRIDRAGDRVQF